MSFACHSHVICMSLVCTCMSSVCHSCVLVCHPYVTRIYSYVIGMSLVCTRMSSVCHSYVLVCHPYVTLMYSHVIRMSLVCTRMSSVCHSHPYAIRIWFYHEPFRKSFFQLTNREKWILRVIYWTWCLQYVSFGEAFTEIGYFYDKWITLLIPE